MLERIQGEGPAFWGSLQSSESVPACLLRPDNTLFSTNPGFEAICDTGRLGELILSTAVNDTSCSVARLRVRAVMESGATFEGWWLTPHGPFRVLATFVPIKEPGFHGHVAVMLRTLTEPE